MARKRKTDQDPRLNDTLSISSKINLDPRVLAGMSEEEAREYLLLQERLLNLEQKEQQRGDFLSFVRAMWPQFIAGRHHKIMADAFERVRRGELKRLIINMPPRHTKSEFASFMLLRQRSSPSWAESPTSLSPE